MRGGPRLAVAAVIAAAAVGALPACRSSEPAAPPPPPDAAARIRELEALGYLDGYEPPRGDATGVVVHDAARAWPGPSLVHAGGEASAELIAPDGRVLHRWARSFADTFPDDRAYAPEEHGRRWPDWRRVRLLPDGGLVAVFEGFGMVRLDAASRVVWALPNRAHHDVRVLPDGRLVALVRKAHVVPRFGSEPVLEDYVVVLDGADGHELARVSVLEALAASPWAHLVDRGPRDGDPFHTNAVVVLDGTGAGHAPFLVPGHWLVSLRDLDTVAVVDPERGVVTWAATGPWRAQHDPSVLPSGHLLVFDNQGFEGRSRAVEVDPVDGRIAWQWPARPDPDFASRLLGAAQRLPTGDTVVVDSDSGRAVEVTPAGEVVWAYVTPKRAGEGGRLIATLLDVQRLPPDLPTPWAVSP